MPGPLPLELVPKLADFLRRKLRIRRSWQEERDAASCLLGLSGLRISEVTGTKVTDIRSRDKAIRVRTIKGGRDRTIPVDDETWASLQRQQMHAASLKTPWLFHTRTGRRLDNRNLRRRWSQYVDRVIGRHYRFHDLRHTAAQWSYEKSGRDMITVQRVLGHAKLTNTALYLRSLDSLSTILPTAKSREDRTDGGTGTGRSPDGVRRGKMGDHRERKDEVGPIRPDRRDAGRGHRRRRRRRRGRRK